MKEKIERASLEDSRVLGGKDQHDLRGRGAGS